MNPPLFAKAAPWLVGAALALMLAVMTHLYMSERDALAVEKTNFATFVSRAELIGKEAEADAKRKEIEGRQLKENTDATYQNNISALSADVKRLRNSRSSSSGGGLRTPAAITSSSGTACFESAKLDAALQKLDDGVLGIVESGSEAVIGLDTAKQWASGIRK